jgi:trehalose 6-phosphate synthase
MISATEPSTTGPAAGVLDLAHSLLQGRRLILASNRGPVECHWNDEGNLKAQRGSGGVVTALSALGHHVKLSWVASAMTDGDRAVARAGLEDRFGTALDGADIRIRFALSSPRAYDLFYNVFANPLLWFVQHELQDLLLQRDFPALVQHAWHEGYRPVNEDVARVVLDELGRLDTAPVVMLHDYQLYLTAGFIRERAPEAFLQQFVHIPWPQPQTWQVLPGTLVRALCRGLLANDIVGFQTKRDVNNFLATCEAVLPECSVSFQDRAVRCSGRRTLVRDYPISIDVGALRKLAASSQVMHYERLLQARCGEKTIVRVDRLDPSKNVLAGFQAFENLLERRPDLRGQVRFLSFLVPTRTAIAEYKRHAEMVFAKVEAINKRFQMDDWQPIEVFYENNYHQAIAAMRLYDVLMINSGRDGMNLVSKEGPVVNRRDGALVLSRGAGSHEELGAHALSVAPFDVESTSVALERALEMPRDEKARRAVALRQVIEQNDIAGWLEAQLADIDDALYRQRRLPEAAYTWRSA